MIILIRTTQSFQELGELLREFENPHLPFVTSAILEETGYVPDPKKFTEKQILRFYYLPQKPKLNQEIMKLPGVVDELAVVNLDKRSIRLVMARTTTVPVHGRWGLQWPKKWMPLFTEPTIRRMPSTITLQGSHP